MPLKKSKIFIYTVSLIFILNFIAPICSFAFDKDSVYVWSNNSSSVPTVNTSNEEAQDSIAESTSR